MSFETAMTRVPNQLLEEIKKFSKQLAVYQIPDEMRATIAAAQSLPRTRNGLFSGLANWYQHEGYNWLKTAAEATTYWKNNVPHWHQTAVKLSDECWFAGPSLGYNDLVTLMDTAHKIPEIVDETFMRFYTNELDSLTEEICSYFPARAGIIRSAVDAHRAGLYYLSVPTFLSQSDGFCYDVNRSLFDGKGNDLNKVKADPAKRIHIKHDAQNLTEKNEGLGLDGFFLPILGKVPNIALGEPQRKAACYHGLNRNTVLHGEDTTYGTEINSLKAFSFMVFIAGFIHAYQEEMNILASVTPITDG